MPFIEEERKFIDRILYHRNGAERRRKITLRMQWALVYSIPILSLLLVSAQLTAFIDLINNSILIKIMVLVLGLLISILSFILRFNRPNSKIIECDKAINIFSEILEEYELERTEVDTLKYSENEKQKKKIELLKISNKKLRQKILDFNCTFDKIQIEELNTYLDKNLDYR